MEFSPGNHSVCGFCPAQTEGLIDGQKVKHGCDMTVFVNQPRNGIYRKQPDNCPDKKRAAAVASYAQLKHQLGSR